MLSTSWAASSIGAVLYVETMLKARYVASLADWSGHLAAGCMLYGIFISRLSACIFEWNVSDVSKLQKVKKAAQVVLSDHDVATHITKKELVLHCQ